MIEPIAWASATFYYYYHFTITTTVMYLLLLDAMNFFRVIEDSIDVDGRWSISAV